MQIHRLVKSHDDHLNRCTATTNIKQNETSYTATVTYVGGGALVGSSSDIIESLEVVPW